MHVSKYFFRTWNDKQITVNDTFPVDVWQGEKFRRLRYTLITKQGVPVQYQGVWLAVDGGYQKVACFINQMHNRYGFSEVAFSEWLESVRKDVECAFGILKIRFRFLRGFVLFQEPETLENTFRTAAMLHNMLLDWDGLNDFHWENLDPDGDLEDEVVPVIVPAETHPVDEDVPVLAVPVDFALHRPRYVPYFQGNYDLIREAIKDHFTYQYNKGMKGSFINVT